MALERSFHRITGLQLIVAQTITPVKEGSQPHFAQASSTPLKTGDKQSRLHRCNMKQSAIRQAEKPLVLSYSCVLRQRN
jgi:hypothetical protein